jgi:hypothetical protein
VSTNGRHALTPGTVITSSGNSGTLVLASSSATTVTLMGDISAVSGTSPSITFGVAWDNGADHATHPVPSFGTATTGAAKTTTGTDLTLATATKSRVGTNEIRYFRVSWTVTGTSPSFTLANLWIVES